MSNILDVKNVSFSFRHGEEIIHSVNLAIKKGDVIGLVGPIGAGKTTLLRIISGLYIGNSGTVEWAVGKKNISYLPASQGLSEMLSVQDNINIWKKAYDVTPERVSALITTFGMEKLLKKTVSKLSSGMKQKTAAAIACLIREGLFIFDEPFTNMDYEHCQIVKNELMQNSSNKGIIVSSHNLDYIDEMCNKIIFIKNGRVIKTVEDYKCSGDRQLKTLYDATMKGE